MKTINVFKNEQREVLYVTGQTAVCKVTDIKSNNGKILIDIAGASGSMQIGGFGGSRRVVNAYANVSAVGNANNVLVFSQGGAASAAVSMFSIATSSASTQKGIRKMTRSNCIIAANSVITVTGSGTTPKNLRATVVIETMPV